MSDSSKGMTVDQAAAELTRLNARVAELEASLAEAREKIEWYATNAVDRSDAWDRLALEAQKRKAAERERDEARSECERLRAVYDAAAKLRGHDSSPDTEAERRADYQTLWDALAAQEGGNG